LKKNKSSKLIIVESPTKARLIQSLFTSDIHVLSCKGHLLEMKHSPEKQISESQPLYRRISAKSNLVLQLQKAADQADEIFIATDPDREGEAIAYHLQYILEDQNKPIRRIDLTELSRESILYQIRHPRKINRNEVLACQARNVVDRMIGSQISPLLAQFEKGLLSARRVQSAALALICERERFIKREQSKTDWKIQIQLQSAEYTSFKCLLMGPSKKDVHHFSEKATHKINKYILNQRLTILAISVEEYRLPLLAPLNTSLLLQEAIPYLGKRGKPILRLLQCLYEGVETTSAGLMSLITYPRTESKVLNSAAVKGLFSFCNDQFPENELVFRKDIQNNTQQKEAIRPLYLNQTMAPARVNKSLNKNLYALYEFIWNRTLAVFLKPPQFQKMTLLLGSDEERFEVTCFRKTREGYSAILREYPGRPEPLIERAFQVGEQLRVTDVRSFSFLPDRHQQYREPDLIRELDQLGIGRPGTYAEILPLLLKRGYVTAKNGLIEPTPLGERINHFLQQHFNPIFRLTVTTELENEFSRIARGEQNYGIAVNRFRQTLQCSTDDYLSYKRLTGRDNDRACERCGRPMIKRRDRRGVYWHCSSDPHCTK
jgi:DNA topoisomerase I